MITAKTALFALLGFPVDHSLSPPMHNAAFAELGINAVYLAFAPSPSQLAPAVAGLCQLGSRGWNITAPHKQKAGRLADELVGPAGPLGTVNTMLWDGERLVGHNTDVYGLQRAWQEHGVVSGWKLLLLGSGGAAAAAAWAACSLELPVTIASRSRNRDLMDTLHAHFPQSQVEWCPWENRHLFVPAARIVLNATPLERPLEPTQLQPHQLACDLVYQTTATGWLKAAAGQGCTTMDGRELLLHQGAKAFSLFTGMPAPLTVMRDAIYGGVENAPLSDRR